jgi:hypothetical protein
LLKKLKQAFESAGVCSFDELFFPQTTEAEAGPSKVNPGTKFYEGCKSFFGIWSA